MIPEGDFSHAESAEVTLKIHDWRLLSAKKVNAKTKSLWKIDVLASPLFLCLFENGSNVKKKLN